MKDAGWAAAVHEDDDASSHDDEGLLPWHDEQEWLVVMVISNDIFLHIIIVKPI